MTGLALFVFIALQIADVYTTQSVLRNGGYEKNPVMAAIMDYFGPAKQ